MQKSGVLMNKITEKNDMSIQTVSSSVLAKRTGRKFSPKKKNKKFLIILVATLCIVGALFGGTKLVSANNSVYCITADGQPVVALSTQDDAYATVDQYLSEQGKSLGLDVSTKEALDIEKLQKDTYEPVSIEEAVNLLRANVTPVVQAASLKIDDSQELFLANEEDAKQAIESAKAYYINAGDKVLDAKLRESVAICKVTADAKNIISPEIAANMLLFGSPQKSIHKIESSDETLWTIANQYGIDIDVLKAANPGLTSDQLQVGSSVRLSTASPMVTVVVVKETVKTAALPFQVETKTNSSLLRGTTKTITEGQYGAEEVTLKVIETNGCQTSQERISSVTTVEPVNKVVAKGTKMTVASRGSGNGGTVGWPLSGNITSRFGSRSLGYHTGIDINGETGDTIVAAESGKVIYAAYNGSYGNIVKIDHGDGLQTWYAHCNSFYVSSGDSVSKGQAIATVGSTGRSTGSHLHFEVRINGAAYNPLNYLP